MVVIMALIMNKFIDIHNHSLPGVDDGAKSIDEAIKNIDYLSPFFIRTREKKVCLLNT